ncbi:MAG: radical SAM protein [Deltaproteobacteria bacterium]|nr:radical SAM protein [Deltaproteobacteria bacterium]
MNHHHKKYLFVYGPVASRRLKRSLGVDLVPFKTCSYNCVYCQIGKTKKCTLDRMEYMPVQGILEELREKLKSAAPPNYIGLAGSGEPTLHSRIGEIIEGIKALTDIPVAVLTNGSFLWKPEVRAGLAGADLVLPSLDAGSAEVFHCINRPHPDITFDKMVNGLVDFSHAFQGRIHLEVFIVKGINDSVDSVKQIAAITKDMRLDRVDLNTVSRPPAENVTASPFEALESMCTIFPCDTRVIAETHRTMIATHQSASAESDIVALLNRRPCTIEGVAKGLGLHPNEVVKHLDVLHSRGVIRAVRSNEAVFYEGIWTA